MNEQTNKNNDSSDLKKISAGQFDAAAIYFNIGNEFYSLGDYNKAIENYLKAIDIDPNNAIIYHNAGIISIELDRYELAQDFFNKAVLLDNKNDQSFYFLGFTNEMLGDHIKALEYYNTAIVLNPDNASAGLAINNLSTIVSQGKEDASTFYEMGLSELEKGNNQQAKDHFLQAIIADPENVGAHYKLAVLYYNHSDFLKALEYFNRAIVLNKAFSDDAIYKALKNKLKTDENSLKLLAGLKDRLNNINPRNRSLRLLRISKEWNFDLSVLDKVEPDASKRILACLINDVTPINLISFKDNTGYYDELETNDQVLKLHKNVFNHLNLLYRKVRSLEAETGIYDFFVGYPFVECKTLEGTYLRAPLILNPCHIEKVNNPGYGWALNTDSEFRPMFNDTLFLALKKFNNINIPEEFTILEKEQEEKDLIGWTIDYFKKYSIPLEVDHRLNGNILELPEYRLEEIPDLPTGKLFIRPYAVLGIFPQSSSNLRPDYELMINKPESLGTILELLGSKISSDDAFNFINNINIDRYSEKENFAINITDESQEKILISSRNKTNFVIHGPPGTGKSHIILNIICDALARNLKILVVCQKRAALDVIYNRLVSEGLSDNIALVHDHERDKRNIFSKLQFLITQIRSAINIGDNTIENYDRSELSKSIDSAIAELNELSYCLQKTSDHGFNIIDMYIKVSTIDLNLRIKLNNKYNDVNYNNFKDLITPIIAIGSLYEKYKDPEYLLAHRKNWSGKTDIFKDQLVNTFKNISKYNENIQNLNNYFKSMDVFIYIDKSNNDSLFIRRNKLITYFSSRNIKLADYKISIDAFKAGYINIKNDYYKLKKLLTETLQCNLTLLELYKKILLINDSTIISIAGFENTINYNNLESFIDCVCNLSKYYEQFETDSFLLKKEYRTDWQTFNADNICALKEQIQNISYIVKLTNNAASKIEKYQTYFTSFISLLPYLDGFLKLIETISTDRKILNTLLDWEKAGYPLFDYDRSIQEASVYINNLNNNRWDTFKEIDLISCEALSDNLKTYSKFNWAIKYVIPAWWKSKKNINCFLKTLNIEIKPENFNQILNKTALTLDYHKLQQIINIELSFISGYNSYKEAELISLLRSINPFFSLFKDFRSSTLNELYEFERVLSDPDYCEEVLKDLRNINDYVKLYSEAVNKIYNLVTFFNKELLEKLISYINNEADLTSYLTCINENLEAFEDIIMFDKLYNQLSEAQQYIIKALVKEISPDTINADLLWKKTIYNSFLKAWLKQEECKYPDLNNFSYQELLELGKHYTQEKFEEFLVKSAEILDNFENVYSSIDKLSFAFDNMFIDNLKKLINNYDKLQEVINNVLNCFDDYDNLIELDNRIDDLSPDQKQLFNELRQKWQPPQKDLADIWEKALTASVFELWIKDIENENPVLTSVSSNTIIKTIETLKDSYQNKLLQNKNYILKTLEDKNRKLLETDKIRGVKKLKDLEYQVNKKRYLWPIRKLVNEFKDNLIFELLPCWLMSPESVSSIMPYEKGLFDIVIFDEASQCPQEYALPSIVRAKQIIIAGDEKQLPPMNIFHTSVDDDLENELVSDAQSLLTLTKAVYPTCFLSWHYRSQFEELINFSNHAYYDGRIQIAPNILTEIKPPAIEWHKIEGARWVKNTNKKEAQAIVDFVAQLLTSDKKPPTIGIITFNNTQQNLIHDLMEKKEADDPVFKAAMLKIQNRNLDERIFIKNIENVQGDEREMILFSIGYAPNFQGKILTNFGLLNRAGGENRLNVAISRAKKKIHVFCSVEPEDFNVEKAKNPGPRLFKKYLEYARSVSESSTVAEKHILKEINPHYENQLAEETIYFSNDLEKNLYERLTRAGFTVHTKIGCSGYKIDLAIVHPDDASRYILGLECDTKNYFRAISARSRSITRKEFLEAKGWKIEHIWSRNWWLSSDNEFERILALIQQLRN